MDKKTAMQEFIDNVIPMHVIELPIIKQEIKKALEKEKEQIIEAYEDGKQNGIESITNVNKYTIGEYYYNQTYGNGK
jgi:hypothetical protein